MSQKQALAMAMLVACIGTVMQVSCSPPDKTISPSGAANTPAQKIQDPAGLNLPVIEENASTESTGLVGTKVCAGCHQKQYQSYQATAHSRSLQRVSDENVDLLGTLPHPLSRTSFDVFTADKGVRHRQWKHYIDSNGLAAPEKIQLSDTDTRMLIGDLPVSHVMGSGSFAKGYLLADKQYLIQSPVTWYRGPKAFGMAPGYDFASHSGMTRVISDECLFCHAGSISSQNGNDEQLEIHETAIGCERCHGPGEVHSIRFADQTKASATADDMIQDAAIIHPGKLPRDLSEAICAQCHLQGDIVVDAVGKSIWDFKPGERLSDTRVTYKVDSAQGEEKTFVDHFDQLWQSKCYLNSDSLTCVTCHDPHHLKGSDENAESDYQQANCLTCHTDQSCGLQVSARNLENGNRCVLCHMPKSASEVPHAATTNHQISIPRQIEKPSRELRQTRLRRLHSPLAAADEIPSERTELLAKAFWVLDNVKKDDIPDSIVRQAMTDLIQWQQDHDKDPQVLVTIARLARKNAEAEASGAGGKQSASDQWGIASDYANQVLAMEAKPTANRKAALEIVATVRFESGDFSLAIQSYQELTRIRRAAVDWYNLGLCYGRVKKFSEAQQALQEAIRIDGAYAAPYRSMAILYSSINPPLAERMLRTHEWLMQSTASQSH